MSETSYGVVPVRRVNDQWEVLIIQHHAGHWGFPKGHGEDDETPQTAAERELLEETALHIEKFFSHESLTEYYHFRVRGSLINKTVHYFIAEVSGDVVLQEIELKDFKWVPLKEAEKFITFPQAKSIAGKALLIVDEKS